jgi:hypothetical protein
VTASISLPVVARREVIVAISVNAREDATEMTSKSREGINNPHPTQKTSATAYSLIRFAGIWHTYGTTDRASPFFWWADTARPLRQRGGERSTWVKWVDGDGSAAVCQYSVRAAEAPDAPDAEECLLEFPVARARGLEAVGLSAARTYFRKKYGGNGLRLHSTLERHRTFLPLDQGPCRMGWVVGGLRVVP